MGLAIANHATPSYRRSALSGQLFSVDPSNGQVIGTPNLGSVPLDGAVVFLFALGDDAIAGTVHQVTSGGGANEGRVYRASSTGIVWGGAKNFGNVISLALSGNDLFAVAAAGGFITGHYFSHFDATDGTQDDLFTKTSVQSVAATSGAVYIGYSGSDTDPFLGQHPPGIAKLTADGTAIAPSDSFNTGQGFVNPGSPSGASVDFLFASADGLYASGDFVGYRGAAQFPLAKIALGDGSVDPTFSSGLGFGAQTIRTASDAGADLVVGGSFQGYQGTPAQNLARFDLTTHAFTASAAQIGLPSEEIQTLLLDGSTLYVGGLFAASPTSPGMLARVTLPGMALDATFLPPCTGFLGGSSSPDAPGVYALALFGGTLWVGGNFATFYNQPVANAVAPGCSGTATPIAAGDLVQIADGNPPTRSVNLAAGATTFALTSDSSDSSIGAAEGASVVFYDAAGNPQAGVSLPSISGGEVFASVPSPGGSSWLVGGNFSGPESGFLSGASSADCLPSNALPFSVPGGSVFAMAPLAADSIFVGGDFVEPSGSYLVRLRSAEVLPDGCDAWIVDPQFSVALNGPVFSLELTDGILVVSGVFSTYNGEPAFALIGIDPFSGDRVF